MSEQRKLPFVWELDHNGTKSYVIGTHHNLFLYPEVCKQYLKGKKYLLSEVPINVEKLENELAEMYMNTLGAPIKLKMDFAFAAAINRGISRIQLETQGEGWKATKLLRKIEEELHKRFRRPISREEREKKYLSGDLEQALRTDYQYLNMIGPKNASQLRSINEARNRLMVARSIPYLPEGCTITTGLIHLITQPSMLRMYESRGIKVRRIQPAQ